MIVGQDTIKIMYILFVYHKNFQGEFYEFDDLNDAQTFQSLHSIGRKTKLIKIK